MGLPRSASALLISPRWRYSLTDDAGTSRTQAIIEPLRSPASNAVAFSGSYGVNTEDSRHLQRAEPCSARREVRLSVDSVGCCILGGPYAGTPPHQTEPATRREWIRADSAPSELPRRHPPVSQERSASRVLDVQPLLQRFSGLDEKEGCRIIGLALAGRVKLVCRDLEERQLLERRAVPNGRIGSYVFGSEP